MRDASFDMLQFIVFVGGSLALMVTIFFGIKYMDRVHCDQKWEGSGFETRIKRGCQVKVDGVWIPEANVAIGKQP